MTDVHDKRQLVHGLRGFYSNNPWAERADREREENERRKRSDAALKRIYEARTAENAEIAFIVDSIQELAIASVGTDAARLESARGNVAKAFEWIVRNRR